MTIITTCKTYTTMTATRSPKTILKKGQLATHTQNNHLHLQYTKYYNNTNTAVTTVTKRRTTILLQHVQPLKYRIVTIAILQ